MTALWRHCGAILLGSSLILALSLGVRHGFGLFLPPMSGEFGWGREVFAFAIALQNLIWGLVQPFTGAFADRFGVARTVVIGALLYGAGLLLMAFSATPGMLSLSAGLLIGLGLSGTSFSVLLGAVGQAVPVERRSMAMGIAAAAGSFGQFIMLPASLGLISSLGWSAALLVLAALIALLVPLALLLRGGQRPAPLAGEVVLGAGAALREALAQRDFWLLGLGFFVCGFQVVFIGVHLPAYLVDRQLAAGVGTTVLALVGLFNVFGTYLSGWLGGCYPKPRLLVGLYLIRALVIAAFIYAPLSEWSAYAFGMAMGFLWLSTVPLTNGTVATLFGVRNLSMLGGLVFLFHQLGSFVGGWLGGWMFDRTGSYDLVWQIAILLSLLAALLNAPVRERPVLRTDLAVR